MITEGKMQYLYDDKGRRYLDVSLATAWQAPDCGQSSSTLWHLSLHATWPFIPLDNPAFLSRAVLGFGSNVEGRQESSCSICTTCSIYESIA